MSWILGGHTLEQDGSRHYLEQITEPSPPQIIHHVDAVMENGGAVVLGNKPEPEKGVHELVMYADSGSYLLLGGEFSEDGEYLVRTIVGSPGATGFEIIFGEPYPARAISADKNQVRSAFINFAGRRGFGSEFE